MTTDEDKSSDTIAQGEAGVSHKGFAWYHRLRSPAKWFSLVVLGALIAVFAQQPVKDWLEARSSSLKGGRYVAVIMSDADDSFTIPLEFKQGFERNTVPLVAQDRSILQTVFRDDNYSVSGAQELARALINDPNCALIVGSSNSELTRVTLRAIVAEAPERRPALIMPIATANSLTQIARDGGYASLLRMVPSNRNQAAQISSFVLNRARAARVAILVDEQNREYSEDLSNDLSADLRGRGGYIAYRGYYGDSARLPAMVEFLRRQQLDFVVFVGVSNNGLVLVDDMLANDLRVPVIFTDGGTVSSLIQHSRRLPAGAFFLSSVRTVNGEPTYNPIGADARSLVARILNAVPDTRRNTIRSYIESHRNSIGLASGEAGGYAFDSDGENSGMRFHIYAVRPVGLELQSGY